MPSYTIIVDFELKPGARDRFLELVRINGAASVRDEPGCLRFDILVPADENKVVLYEIYRDEDAFLNGHLKAPHYLAFREGIAGLIERNQRHEFRDLTENDKSLPNGR